MAQIRPASLMNGSAFSSVFSLRLGIAMAIVLTEIVFLSYRFSAGFGIALSSVAVSIALILQLAYAVRADVATPADIAVFIFNWLFLDLAPKIQLLTDSSQLVNTSSATDDGITLTNLVCALFILVFTGCYAALATRKPVLPPTVKPRLQFSGSGVAITLFVCVLLVGALAPMAYHSVDENADITPQLLILNRFLLFIPSAAFLILLQETIQSPRKVEFSRVLALGLLLLLVLATQNPYLEKRNALGPLYLCLILLAWQRWFHGRTRRLLLLVLGMVIVFPAISVFTHDKQHSVVNISYAQMGERIEEYYYSINYDSWSNVYTSIEMAAKHGCQWGYQLLGSIFYFVPSSLWTTKPLSSGIYIGQYLINHYGMWFTNLSAPLVAEGFLDFGWFGVVLYAGLLALLVDFLNKLAVSENRWVNMPLALYGSMFLVFLSRGSLMVAMGFASGAFLAFVTASALLSVRLGVRRAVMTWDATA